MRRFAGLIFLLVRHNENYHDTADDGGRASPGRMEHKHNTIVRENEKIKLTLFFEKLAP